MKPFLLVHICLIFVAVVCAKECKRYYAPKKFIFSTATSAFQIEGGAREDGRGPAGVDIYYHNVPKTVAENDTADISCDSYHKYKEDVQLLKNLGVKQYRFSISWPRILPLGTTEKINRKGIAYYNNLINELIANGIEPLVTMLHWDEPEVLIETGGWLNQEMPKHFGKYARILYKSFGDRVKKWATLNEPYAVVGAWYCGQISYINCPWTLYRSAHYMLLGHAEAYRIYEREFKRKQKGQVGIVLSTGWFEPATNSSEDLAATNRSRDFELGWFAEPIFKGDYPETMRTRIANRSYKDGYIKSRLPEFTEKEKAKLHGSADFLGLNYYSSLTVRNRVDFPYDTWQTEYDGAFSADGLYNYPQGLRKLLVYASKEYGIPVMVTENGLGDNTGTLNDTDRINYVKSHLIGVLQAAEDGANVLGYTVWSLMDNFEWGAGFTIKFGIHHVDFKDPNRKRTPKASAEWYKQVISNRYIDDC